MLLSPSSIYVLSALSICPMYDTTNRKPSAMAASKCLLVLAKKNGMHKHKMHVMNFSN